MVAAWMLWSVGAGALFLLGGLAAEKVLGLYRMPTRWVWPAAGGATLGLPLGRILWPEAAPGEAAVSALPLVLDPFAVTMTSASPLHSLDDVLLVGWVVLSTLMVVTALLAGGRLLRQRRSWETGALRGHSVLWSSGTGPAVIGFLKPAVVLPDWARTASTVKQTLILAHEQEHIRARDPQLRFLMATLLVAFPWNPALWVQLHRLGLAIELDCDRRVMARMPRSRRAYGDLLLRVGAGRSGIRGLAVAALSEQPSHLEKRIRDLVWRAPEARLAQAGVLVFGGMLVLMLAYLVPGIRQALADPELIEASAAAGDPAPPDGSEEITATPTFTPFTLQPNVLNRDEIVEALNAEYPPLLRDAGIEGTAKVWFFIDEWGVLQRVSLNQSTGHDALDRAALRVAEIFKFSPAQNRDQRVAVWVALDIRFKLPDAPPGPKVPPPVVLGPEGEDMRSIDEVRSGPTLTPFTRAPDILNRPEVQAAMESEYPPLLRDAGIGGTTNVWFLISKTGSVEDVRVNGSSGHGALDSAALAVARVFKFSPAFNRDEPTPVWVALDITFAPPEGALQPNAPPETGDSPQA